MNSNEHGSEEQYHNHHSYAYHRVNSFDPNLGTAASRYSPPYCQDATLAECTTNSYGNVILVPSSGNIIGHENGLLSVAEAAQTIESGILDQYNILPPDHRIITTYVHSVNDADHNYENIHNQQILTASTDLKNDVSTQNYHVADDDSFVHHENLTDAAGTTHLIFRRSPNGRIYQNLPNFVVNNENNSQNTVNSVGLVTAQHSMVTDVQEVFGQYDNIRSTNCVLNEGNEMVVVPNDDRINLLFNGSLSFDSNHHNHNLLIEQTNNNFAIVEPNVISSNSATAELNNNLNQPTTNANDLISVAVMPAVEDKDQMLEMTMSPLLAAINNVTSKHDGQDNWTVNSMPVTTSEIQYYELNNTTNQITTIASTIMNVNQNDDAYKNNFKIINLRSSISDEYVDINDVKSIELVQNENKINDNIFDGECEFEDLPNSENEENTDSFVRKSRRKKKEPCLMVADKHVPCRAWASLPTNYLYIGKLQNTCAEYTVYSKKDIPLRTKFGPFEGDIREINEIDLDQLKIEKSKKYPLLLIGDNHILETSNENTSNWMRFVRFAENYTQQNLLLFETSDKLYFKSCQFIRAKQELRVGYSRDYANKYDLEVLEPSKNDLDSQNEWPCFECDKKFETSEDMQKHLNEHDIEKPKKIVRKKKTFKRKGAQRIVCPVCSKSFFKHISFRRHIRNHNGHPLIEKCLNDPENNKAQNNAYSPKKSLKKRLLNINQKLNNNKENSNNISNFKCDLCSKSFLNAERLKKHELVHSCPNETKPYQCSHCIKRFLTLSAMAAHVKIHIYGRSYFQCLICKERFKQNTEFSLHVKIHMVDGYYSCAFCNKKFTEYVLMRKHIRAFHPAWMFTCTICDKKFPALDKLRLHMLSHSDKKDFLCSICGKQFKRKDKLKEHIKKIHNPDNSNKSKLALNISKEPKKNVNAVNDNMSEIQNEENDTKKSKTKFLPKVSPNDYQRFIYKCHDCLLGFKRRGMLVNHLAKRHPDIRIESVPELNLPILKSQKYFYCQYCNKVYRSSAKRKSHILKYHPGSELPMSGRQKGGVPEIPGLPNPTFTEVISTITTHPHSCDWCHKQYASRTKLIQHQRNKHADDLKNKLSSDDHLYELKSNEYENNHKHVESSDEYHPNGINYDINSTTHVNGSVKETSENYITDLLPLNPKDNRFIKVSDKPQEFSNSSSSSNSELSHFFDDIDYMNLRPVVMQSQTTNTPHSNDLLNLQQNFDDNKKIINNYTFSQNGG